MAFTKQLSLTAAIALMAGCATLPTPSRNLDPETAKSGATLTRAQEAYDVQHYRLDLEIFPSTKQIAGTLTAKVKILAPLERIEFDLDARFLVGNAMVDGVPASFQLADHKTSVVLPQSARAGDEITVSFSYEGKPHIALAPPWHGGFVWSSKPGAPWIATAVQGHGCDLWWPCKDHHGDKPDQGMDINVTVPAPLKVATNGTLRQVVDHGDGRKTWEWSTRHPITSYLVALNIGPYELVKSTYRGRVGVDIPIEFWVLPENAEKARKLVEEDAKKQLASFERLVGPYPWGDEKIGFVETPHLGMEHQTINAYGEDYDPGKDGFDWLMHHELSHEWFGNLMTHDGAADAWLHEGYGLYMQAAYAEEVVGQMGYTEKMFTSYIGSENCLPVAPLGETDTDKVFENGDIYTKGAWVLHTFRRMMGDEAFWRAARLMVYGTTDMDSLSYPLKPIYRSTEDFIRIMSQEAGRDLRPFVEAYLYEADLPELLTERDGDVLRLKWQAGGDRPFPMPIAVQVGQERITVPMTDGVGAIAVGDRAPLIIDPDNDVLRAMPIVDPCQERQEAEDVRLDQRYQGMALHYGWERE